MQAIRSAALLLAFVLAGMPAREALAQPAESSKKAAPKENDDLTPMAFFVAKGEANVCGPGCSEWIAADGFMDSLAPERLRALLDRLGKRKLPIYFHSPGGIVSGGIKIGRMMRERGMTAGVARTIPTGCDHRIDREAACEKLKRSGRELLADLRTVDTLCNSSCVYALLGATVREVTAGARIGVHAIAVAVIDKKSGQMKTRATTETLLHREAASIKFVNTEVAKYVTEMGIDRGLYEAAAEIQHERLRYISRDEIARFGIDRREFHESRWVVHEGPRGPFVVVKFATEARGEPKRYRTIKIELGCLRSGDVRVTFSREIAQGDKAGSIAVSAHGGDFVLPPRRGKPISGYNDIEMEDRFARVPIAFFRDAASGDTIELTEAPDLSALDKPPTRLRLSTAGLKSAIAVLAQRCQ